MASCGGVFLSGCWRFDHVESGSLSAGVVVLGSAALQGKRDGWEAVAFGIFTGKVCRNQPVAQTLVYGQRGETDWNQRRAGDPRLPERNSICVLINPWTKS